ncbi:PH domain-containing protein [Embleya sp. NPDC050154]|uniref:PH domain-containing protein n=1 Tax=Embleya sp. NPDC050154 TaxID=3363988 RepID=UPI0037AD15FE
MLPMVFVLGIGVVATVGIASETGWFSLGPLLMGLFPVLMSFELFRVHVIRATVVDGHGVTLRGVIRTRVVEWRDVQGIEIETLPWGLEDQPTRAAVLYDSTGRKYDLPNMDDLRTDDLNHEVNALRETWVRRRGEHWASVPEVAARIRRDRGR